MAIRFQCNAQILGWLANVYDPTPLSLLSTVEKNESLSDQDRDWCMLQGIINDQNIIEPQIHQVLLELSNAVSARRIQLNKFGNATEKTVYFSNNLGVSVDQQAQNYIINYPVSIEATVLDIKEFIGDGQYVDVDISLVVPRHLFKTFVCALDWQRHAALFALSQNQPAAIWFTQQDLFKQTENPSLNQFVNHMDFLDLDVSELDVDAAVNAQLLIQEESKYRLSDDTIELGLSMLLLDLVVDLMSIVSNESQYEISRARVFVFDRHNLVYVEGLKDACEFTSISGDEVLSIVKEIIS